MLFHNNSQICGVMSVDLLANRKHLNKIWGIFVHAKNAINAILSLTLRRMLTQSLDLNLFYENVSFVLENAYTRT